MTSLQTIKIKHWIIFFILENVFLKFIAIFRIEIKSEKMKSIDIR